MTRRRERRDSQRERERTTRRATVMVSLASTVLIAVVQYLTWRDERRLSPALLLLLVLVLGPLWLALRRGDAG